ncbi:MAG: hypothetical protein HZB12_00420 [Candidatus Yonathbacteria bacterium]|nr:hypothetical protein [Candidatus Yonathbacteria bacterium]
MKNIKKIISGIIAAAAFIAPTASFAATFDQGIATLLVANKTTNAVGCTTCWTGTANASAGQVISFAIYYHNIGVDTATNVQLRLTPQSTGVGTAQTFTATVSADNALAVTGTATVTLSSSQSLSFTNGTALWFPNQTQVGTVLPLAQTGAELFNGVGLNVGNVAPGWASQGSVTVSFQISSTGGTGGSTGTLLPTVTTQSATNVAGDYALLNGYVDPRGTSDTTYWFEWGTNANQGGQNQTTRYNQGSVASNVSASLSGLMQNATYYYRAVAQNSQGVVYGATYSFTTGNTVNNNNCGAWGWGGSCGNNIVMVSTRNADTSGDFAVLNGYVDPVNTNDTVRWFEWGGSQALGNSTQKLSQGNVASNFSASLTGLVSNTTYYYRATARNSQGTVYGNILSFTTGGQQTNNNSLGTLPAATTLLATELTGATAKLNGLVFTSANQPSNAWFEWGTNSALGNKTQTVSVGMLPSVKHSEVINGLVQGQTYYYRIVAENPYGKVYGSINSFVSEGNAVVQDTTVVINNTPRPAAAKSIVTVVNRGSSAQSLVALSLDGGSEVIAGGDKRSYHVVWKNESAQSLKNVVLRVIFPQTMNFESATNGAFSAADNAVILDIKTLAPSESGDVFITATADRALKAGELVVITANMVYTSADGVQGDAIAYVTHRADMATSALGASIFGAGSFLPTTLLGWITLIMLVLILVLLGNHLYGRFAGAPSGH